MHGVFVPPPRWVTPIYLSRKPWVFLRFGLDLASNTEQALYPLSTPHPSANTRMAWEHQQEDSEQLGLVKSHFWLTDPAPSNSVAAAGTASREGRQQRKQKEKKTNFLSCGWSRRHGTLTNIQQCVAAPGNIKHHTQKYDNKQLFLNTACANMHTFPLWCLIHQPP